MKTSASSAKSQLIDQASDQHAPRLLLQLLRQHFHLVGIDPGFSVMDGEEAQLLRLEVGRELLQDRYELDADGAFQRLVDAYAEGDDERLLRHVLRAHEMLCSLVDPAGWTGRARARLVEAAEGPLLASELGKDLIDLLGRRLAAMRQRCAAALDLVTRLEHFPKYVEQLRDLSQALKHWEKVLTDEGPDALAEEMKYLELPKLPPIKSDVPGKDVAKAAIDAVRKEVKDGGWRDTLRFTADQWRDGVRLVAAARPGLPRPRRAVRHPLPPRRRTQARQVDFSDLERFALEVLRDPRRPDAPLPSPTARAYHRQFKHVLVDEYQDINELQDAILSLLSHECGDAARAQPLLRRRREAEHLPLPAGRAGAVPRARERLYRRRPRGRRAGDRPPGEFPQPGAAAGGDQRRLRAADDPRGGRHRVRRDRTD